MYVRMICIGTWYVYMLKYQYMDVCMWMCVCVRVHVCFCVYTSVCRHRRRSTAGLSLGGPLGHPLQDFQRHVLGRIKPGSETAGVSAWLQDLRLLKL